MIFHSYVSLPEGNSQAWNKAFCGWLPLRTIICCSSSSMTSVILQCTFLSSFLCPKSMFRVKSWKDLRNTNWAAIFQCVASKKNKMILENLKTHQFDSLIQNVCVRQHNMALLRASLYSLTKLYPRVAVGKPSTQSWNIAGNQDFWDCVCYDLDAVTQLVVQTPIWPM